MNYKFSYINLQVLIEIIIYVTSISLFSWLITSDKYKIFISPKILPWLIFFIIILVIWTLSSILYLFKPRYKNGFSHLFTLIIPITLIFGSIINTSMANVGVPETNVPIVHIKGDTLKPSSSSDNTVSVTDSNNTSSGANNPSKPSNTKQASSTNSNTSQVKNTSKNNIASPDYGIDKKNKTIILNTDNYYDTILEVSTKLPSFIGYKMKLNGFVTRNDQYYDHGDFMVARMAMTCCAADVAPVGVVAYYDESSKLPDNTWVEVEGTIIPHDFLGLPQIALKINKLNKIAPISGYVYPQ